MSEKTTEFEKGFDDGLAGIQSKPTSLSYVEGYLRGQEVAKIGQTEKSQKEPGIEGSEIWFPFRYLNL